jgi:hypothetical protein
MAKGGHACWFFFKESKCHNFYKLLEFSSVEPLKKEASFIKEGALLSKVLLPSCRQMRHWIELKRMASTLAH